MRDRSRLTGKAVLPVFIGGLLAGFTARAASAEPPSQEPAAGKKETSAGASKDEVLSYLKDREAVQMLSAIARGSRLGPGKGWFRGGESRYGWDWLAERYDTDGDGAITGSERQEASLLNELDRNEDGAIRRDDFDWSEESPFVRRMDRARRIFRRIDTSSNGRVTREEWEAFLTATASEDGEITPRELRKALFPPRRNSGGGQGPSPLMLATGILQGEIGSIYEGPAVGDVAPGFELPTQDGERSVRLSQFRGKRPVVLIFGSFT